MNALQDTTDARCPRWLFAAGAVSLLVAVAATVMLSISRFAGMWLPGCGPGGGCDRAAESIWGAVPGLGWPTSSVGLAYFLGLFAAWVAMRGVMPNGFRWLVRLGAVASIVFLVAMGLGKYFCVYCVISHLANFAFLMLAEMAPRSAALKRPALATAGVTFVIATGVLGIVEAVQSRAAEEHAEDQLEQSTEQVTQGGGEAFTGRYRRGPEAAPIRIVVFSDFQCTDCKKIEAQISQLMSERDDISLSVKHFPFCTDCNPNMPSNRHPNACWAARAAETAGILAGDEGFFRMHDWLFEHDGSFTAATLPPALDELGFDRQEFLRIMQSDETMPGIEADVEEGMALGLHFTPMIFVNGVELRGFTAPNAVRRMVEAVDATNPEAATASIDRPPTAAEKYINDWRTSSVRRPSFDPNSWPKGPSNAAVRVILFSDYQDPGTLEVDAALREVMANRDDVQYTFRHFPTSEACNPSMSRTIHEQGCRASQAAEAAGILGGAEAYWGMHDWLLAHQDGVTDASLRTAATEIGLDPDTLLAEMKSTAVSDGIRVDAQSAKSYQLRNIPFVVVNERPLPRHKLEGHDVIGQVVEAAGRGE